MRLVAVVLVALAAVTSTAHAQPGMTPVIDGEEPMRGPAAPPPAPFAYPAPEAAPVKSEGAATLLSLGATAGGFALISAGAKHDSGGTIMLGLGALIVGPSAGHIYAGETGHAVGMSLLRGVSFGVMIAGVIRATTVTAADCFDCSGGTVDSDRKDGERMMVVGGLAFVGATVYDIIDASRAARRTNAKHRGYMMMPTMVQSPSGPVPAVGLSGKF